MTTDYRLKTNTCTKLGLNPELCESIELWLDRCGCGIYEDKSFTCSIWNKTETPIEENHGIHFYLYYQEKLLSLVMKELSAKSKNMNNSKDLPDRTKGKIDGLNIALESINEMIEDNQ